MIKRKLKLEWVTDAIGDNYKKWRKGDIVTLQAQTGTGKTYFVKTKLVPYLEDWEKMLVVANRVNLKRQLKKDLFDYYSIPLPHSNKEIDSVTTIGNVTILSYQQISEMQNANNFNTMKLDLNNYKYIVCDECHFFCADAGFNNKCDLAFEQLIRTRHKDTIKIFISATMFEIETAIVKGFEDANKLGFGYYINENKIHPYTTDIDYTYLDIKYFQELDSIINTIKNDKSEDKWIIFVNNIEDEGNFILEELKEYCTIDFITKDTDISENENLQQIINCGSFKCKVLICTKALDNGVNIEDESVKNMVVITYDKTTFIQELGRIRVDIENAYKVNLYIPCKKWQTFNNLINFKHSKKMELVDLYNTDINKFNMIYSRRYAELPSDIFILNKNDEKSPFTINTLGYSRLIKDIAFCEKMKNQFNVIKKFAYIMEQLEWINRLDSFNEDNLLNSIINEEVGAELKEFLEKAYNNDDRFTKEYFINTVNEIIEKDNGLKNLLNKLDNGKCRSKGAKKLNELFRKCDFDFIVGSKKFRVNGKLETKWIVTVED